MVVGATVVVVSGATVVVDAGGVVVVDGEVVVGSVAGVGSVSSVASLLTAATVESRSPLELSAMTPTTPAASTAASAAHRIVVGFDAWILPSMCSGSMAATPASLTCSVQRSPSHHRSSCRCNGSDCHEAIVTIGLQGSRYRCVRFSPSSSPRPSCADRAIGHHRLLARDPLNTPRGDDSIAA